MGQRKPLFRHILRIVFPIEQLLSTIPSQKECMVMCLALCLRGKFEASIQICRLNVLKCVMHYDTLIYSNRLWIQRKLLTNNTLLMWVAKKEAIFLTCKTVCIYTQIVVCSIHIFYSISSKGSGGSSQLLKNNF